MSGVDSDSDGHAKPAPRKKQKTLDDFVKEKPKAAKPAAAPKKAAPAKKLKAIESDDDDDNDSDSLGKSRTPPPKRTATGRAAVVKKPITYVDISSEEEEGDKTNQTDDFELSDD